MADASCSGPSPFKRLVDHQARDVSHHQDRLVDQAGPHGRNTFRSAPQPPGQAQDGYGAFMGGNSALPGLSHDPAGRLQAHAAALRPANVNPLSQLPQQVEPSPIAEVNNWAADFTRFSAGQQNRMPAHAGPAHAPALAMQMNQTPSQIGFQSPFVQQNGAFASHFGFANGGFMNSADPLAAQQPPAANADFDQEMSRWMTSNGGGNMEDVDAAMDQMARELELNDAALAEAETTATEQDLRQEAENRHFTDLETPEIGNLSLEAGENITTDQTLPTAEEIEVGPDAKGKSAVSEAAERLLESVQHEDGDKWKNSVFLSLMRDFRDGRKDIVDNEIRQTGDEESDTAAQRPEGVDTLQPAT